VSIVAYEKFAIWGCHVLGVAIAIAVEVGVGVGMGLNLLLA